jgi:hypothetical protein
MSNLNSINVVESSEIAALAVSGGTSFPLAPQAQELFYRTDLDALFIYDSTVVTNGGWIEIAFSNVAQTITGNWTFSGTVSGATPTSGSELATKAYVDATAAGLAPKPEVQVATTANITLTGLQTIDGYTTLANDRVLVKNQTTSSQNGVYVAGSGAWTVATDFSTPQVGFMYYVENGGQQNSIWVLTSTSPNTFSLFNKASGLNASSPLLITGDTLSLSTTARFAVVSNALELSPSGVVAATYPWGTVDTYGRVTGAFSTIPWSSISLTPTTLAGYGITDKNTLAFNALSNNGIVVMTGYPTPVVTTRQLSAGTGITISNPDGTAGNIGIVNAGVTGLAEGPGITLSSSTGVVTITATGTVTSATASNLANGAAGQIPFQSGPSTTTFLNAPANNQVLVGSGTTPAWSIQPTIDGTNFTTIPNGALVNSSITVGSTIMSLGSSYTSLAGLTSVAATSMSATTFSGALSGNATTATTATVANTLIISSTAANSTYYPTFVSATSGSEAEYTSSALTFNPSTGVLTATEFVGSGAGLTNIPNSSFANSSVTIGSTSITLGGTALSLSGLSSVSSTSFTGALTGNASTASALASTQSITATGDASWTVNFNGSSNVTAALTLATVNTGPVSASFSKVTTNGKGLVTATTPVTISDITAILGTPLPLSGGTMTGDIVLYSGAPATSQSAVPKSYVDNIAAGLAIKDSVTVATTANLTATYNNGTAGVGATLTATTNGSIGTAIGQSYSPVLGDRILVKAQTTAFQNGIYTVTVVGTGSSAFVLTRATDMNASADFQVGAFAYIELGTLAGTQWAFSSTDASPPSAFIVGTNSVNFSQLTGSGTITGGTGISVAGNVVTNTGVTSLAASGSGLSVSSSTGSVTLQNTGVTSIIGGSNITASSATGSVTLSVSGTVPSATNIAGGSAGALVYQTGSGATTTLNIGTTGYVLTSSGTAPQWTAASSVTAGSATNVGVTSVSSNGTYYPTFVSATTGSLPVDVNSSLTFNPSTGVLSSTSFTGAGTGLTGTAASLTAGAATNIASGAAGSLPYQTGAGATSMLALGTSGYVLQAGGSAPSWVAQSTLAVGSATSATNATNATNTAITAGSGTSNFVTFVTGTSGNLGQEVASSLTFNASTGALSATSFSGAGTGLTGTAASLTAGNATLAAAATNITGGTAGALVYQTGASATSFIAAGTNGYVLTMVSGSPAWAASGGGAATISNVTSNSSFYPLFTASTSGSLSAVDVSSTTLSYNPGTATLTTTTFAGALSGNATTATTATNLSGGAAGTIYYQSGPSATTTLPIGTSGYVLTSTGSSPSWTNPSTLSVSTATSATVANTLVISSTATNATYYPTFVSASAGNAPIEVSPTQLTFNPALGILSLPTVSASSGGTNTAGNFTTSGSTASVLITDTGANGANIKLTGNGATTPNKFVRVLSGSFQVVNSANSVVIMNMDDSGNTTFNGNVTASGGTMTAVTFSGNATTATMASTANALTTGNNYQMNSLGVGTAASGTAGEIRATNNVTAYYSDRRLKNISGSISDALAKVNSLSGVFYTNNSIANHYGYTSKEQQVGVIAQEVQAVLPEAVKAAPFDTTFIDGREVSRSGEDYLTVQYEKLVPLLIEAIKELSAEVTALKKKLGE